ncbi:MAG: hypothetical protein JF607_26475, partial [Burkholderiales bacterium]|nr:hypothetical protein [Burkholderiales bacterium]MBW8892313.1 hypothetical protein [Burkholderiales bacterium]
FGNAIGESIASQSQPSPYALSGRLGENGGQSAVRFSDPGLTLQDTTPAVERMERIDIGKLPDSPSLDIDTNLPGPVVIEHLPRVVVTGSRAGASSGLTSETAAEIGGISGRQEGLALAGRYLDYSRQLRGHAANAGSGAIAKTYNSMADGYAAASREASRVSGQFTTYSSVPRQTVNPPSFDVGAGWSYMGANSDGTSSMTRWDSRTLEQIDRDQNRFIGLVVTAPVTVPLLFTGWGFAGAATLGGGTAAWQYLSSGNVDAYDVMTMASFGAALPSLATSAYSLTTRAWSALSFTEAASTSRFVGTGNIAPIAGTADGAGETVTVFRVQGGTPPLASRQLIDIDANGNPLISRTTLNVSMGDPVHAEYFLSKRPGANITSFDIPKWMGDFIDEQAIPQAFYTKNPANQGGLAPKVVDPTTPGRSYELPDIWAKWLEEVAIPGSGKVKKGGTP